MSDFDAAYDAIRAKVGDVTTTRIGPIRALDFQRFAVASGETPGRYDEHAPPLFLTSVLGWGDGPVDDELRPDGTGTEETADLPLSGLRLMGAGQELEFGEPLCDGVTVTVETSIADVQLKEGRSGRLMLLTILRAYSDESGRRLVTCRENFIARPGV
ncbi:FAS1-like dehydratase domain-containing protein [Pseudonocardia acaciae]|uniref:FAS1-like dehydratase domain-containing protein n=1 Tax=Pseudonocardia acaciae TaxID=551276 RepID=UPI00048E2DBA|nr:MaoC family dehydratase N-terminal domain-containing protein [Pseudonocardia acaciae]